MNQIPERNSKGPQKRWAAPLFNRLGRITDIALGVKAGTAQNPGQGTCNLLNVKQCLS